MTGFVAAEVEDVDLRKPLSDAQVVAVRALWRRAPVLVFRDQAIDPRGLRDAAAALGTLDEAPPFDTVNSSVPGLPEIAVVSNVKDAAGAPIGGLGDGDLAWHSDMTHRPDPPEACLLAAAELPAAGGDTSFVDLAAVWDALPADLAAAASRNRLLHDRRYTSAGTPRVARGTEAPGSRHPLARVEPVAGRTVLFLGRRTNAAVDGPDAPAAASLLARLWDAVSSSPAVYRHRWRSGDVLLWNNLRVMHRRDAFDPSARRLLHRAQIGALHAYLRAPAAAAPKETALRAQYGIGG